MADKQATEKQSAAAGKRIQIEYYRSAICTPEKHRKVVKGLGFTRLRQVVEREDTPSVRGMVKAIPHLVRILG
ncbi:MAG: 50S ribosomal protein L30 [Acidobacteriaceae bacterium]|jgi:large subunit ribosomal protein L30